MSRPGAGEKAPLTPRAGAFNQGGAMPDAQYAPMLCQPGDISSLTWRNWAFEAKHDGNRLMAYAGETGAQLYSRSGRRVTDEYRLEIKTPQPVVLDGEAVSLNRRGVPDFNSVQNRAVQPVEYWAFDILRVGDRDLTRVPYGQRRQILQALCQLSTGFSVPDVLAARTGAEAQALSVAAGLEGVVAKSLNGPYEQKRSRHWLKSKNWLEDDVVIGGWKWGTGKRSGTIGAILVGKPDQRGLRYCGKVGTGFSDSELDKMLTLLRSLETTTCPFQGSMGPDGRGACWVSPSLVAAVQYGHMTAEGRMRHPSWRGLR